MLDYLTLGPTPADEDCAQVGSDDYMTRATRETHAYIKQLLRENPHLPKNVKLSVKAFHHDMGVYHEVVVYFDPDDDAAVQAAWDLDENTPAHWDDIARLELGL